LRGSGGDRFPSMDNCSGKMASRKRGDFYKERGNYNKTINYQGV